jgi:site-specific recombinase XerD
MTTRESLDRAFDLRGTPRGTRDAYGWCINRYEGYFGRPASALGREEVETFLLHLVRERKLGPSTHNVYAAALRFVYGAALGRPEVTAGIPRRKTPMRLPMLLSPEQIARLLGAVASVAVRTVLMLAYGAGLRVGEACRLRVEDIDSRSMVLHIRHAKRGRARDVMLSPRLLEALRSYWRQRRPSGQWVFPAWSGEGTLSRRSVARGLRKAARRVGIDDRVTPHTLRHCFATQLLEQGVDLRTVQVLLGHGSMRSTLLYVHVTTARVRSVTSPLDRMPPLSTSAPTNR